MGCIFIRSLLLLHGRRHDNASFFWRYSSPCVVNANKNIVACYELLVQGLVNAIFWWGHHCLDEIILKVINLAIKSANILLPDGSFVFIF